VKELIGLHLHGCWQGHSGPSGTPFAVWHTAQCVIAVAANPVPHPEVIAKGIGWLKRAQHDSGVWFSVQQYNIYFTAYAVLALLSEGEHESPQVRKALEYLKSQMASDGKCSDLGGTLMCAMAFRAVVDGDFEKDLTLVDYLLAQKNLTRAEASEAALRANELELGQVKAELGRYEKKYGEAEFAITKKGLFVLALVALFLAVLGSVAGDALNVVIHRAFLPSVPETTEPAVRASPEAPPASQVAPAKQGGSVDQHSQAAPKKGSGNP
jgi:hypothetical protein